MKKISLALLAAILLLRLTACGTKPPSTDSAATPESPAATGYATEDELILSFIDCLNGDLTHDEFCMSFDAIGLLAYWITEDTAENSLAEAYAACADAQTGAAYINETYPQLANGDFGFTLADGDIADLKSAAGPVYAQIKDRLLSMFKTLDNYGPYERIVDERYKWTSELTGSSSYTIPVNDSKNYIKYVSLEYMYQDGEYRWIMLHQTA